MRMRERMSFIARYVYTDGEFVLVTAPQCDRMTGHRRQKNNMQIGNVQNSKNTIYNTDNVCTGLVCAHLK